MSLIRKIVNPLSKEDKVFYNELKIILSFSPKTLNHYKKAFTHKSIKTVDKKGNPINYERLEFLGDAMLGAVIAAFLYKKAPKESEGYLTQMRSKIVNRTHLNKLGKDFGLIRFVKSNVEDNNVGDNIHGNIFEALIGAIYLDKGYATCEKFIFDKVIDPYIDLVRLEGKITSYKGVIIEWCQKQKIKYSFSSSQDTGTEEVKHFSIKLKIDGKIISKGRDTSKKRAEEKAAKRAYFVFQDKIENP